MLRLAALLEEVAVAVAREESRAGTKAEWSVGRSRVVGIGNLESADVGLVVAEALVLGGILGSQCYRHAGGHGDVNHGLIDALGMHVDFDFAAAVRDGFKERLPERVTAFGNAALAVDAHGEALNFRALLQDDGQGVAAVCSVRFGSQSLDVVIRAWTVGPLISVGPDTQAGNGDRVRQSRRQ